VVEAIVDNRDRRLLPGQYVTMQLVTGERAHAITVPRGAVARLGETAKVWVVSDGRVEPREVTTGLEGADRIEVVRGLAGSERVVARGHENLYAGARVTDAMATAPPTAGVPAAPSKPDEMRSTPRKEGGHGGH
jgi:hypothetical protein